MEKTETEPQMLALTLGPDGQLYPNWDGKLEGASFDVALTSEAIAPLKDTLTIHSNLLGNNHKIDINTIKPIDDAWIDRLEAQLWQHFEQRLHFAKRAGLLVIGHDMVLDAVTRKQLSLVLMAEDFTSGGKIQSALPRTKATILTLGNKAFYGTFMGRDTLGVIGIRKDALVRQVYLAAQRIIGYHKGDR